MNSTKAHRKPHFHDRKAVIIIVRLLIRTCYDPLEVMELAEIGMSTDSVYLYLLVT